MKLFVVYLIRLAIRYLAIRLAQALIGLITRLQKRLLVNVKVQGKLFIFISTLYVSIITVSNF